MTAVIASPSAQKLAEPTTSMTRNRSSVIPVGDVRAVERPAEGDGDRDQQDRDERGMQDPRAEVDGCCGSGVPLVRFSTPASRWTVTAIAMLL